MTLLTVLTAWVVASALFCAVWAAHFSALRSRVAEVRVEERRRQEARHVERALRNAAQL